MNGNHLTPLKPQQNIKIYRSTNEQKQNKGEEELKIGSFQRTYFLNGLIMLE